MQHVGVAQLGQIQILCARECYAAFQDAFGVPGGSVQLLLGFKMGESNV